MQAAPLPIRDLRRHRPGGVLNPSRQRPSVFAQLYQRSTVRLGRKLCPQCFRAIAIKASAACTAFSVLSVSIKTRALSPSLQSRGKRGVKGPPCPQNGSGAAARQSARRDGHIRQTRACCCVLQGRGKRDVKGPPFPQNGSGALRGRAHVGIDISAKRTRYRRLFKAGESTTAKTRLFRRIEVERCAAGRTSGWAYPTNARVLLHPSRPRKARRQRPAFPAERKWSAARQSARRDGHIRQTRACCCVLSRPGKVCRQRPAFPAEQGLPFPQNGSGALASGGHIRRFCNRPRICTGHSNIHLNGPAAAHSPHDFYRRGRAGRFRLYRLPLYSGSDRGFSAITGGVHARVRGIVQKPEALRPVSQPPRITGEWRQAQWRAPITPIDSIIYNKISFVNKCSKKRVHLDALTIPLPNGLPSRFACQGGCGRLCKTL